VSAIEIGGRKIVVRTVADALNYKWTMNDTRREKAFRRGYFYAINDVIDALKAGTTPRQLLQYYNGALWDWHFHKSCEECIMPPEMPEPWDAVRKRILERDKRVCHYCGEAADTVDHKNPVVSGGTDDEDNLVTACRSCNTKKHTKPYEQFIEEMSRS
jgi:hypothetical protein